MSFIDMESDMNTEKCCGVRKVSVPERIRKNSSVSIIEQR